MMSVYRLSMALHLVAVCLWFGHMFFWSLVVGPVTKRLEPPETARRLRQLSLKWGGFGGPALIILVLTGAIMLAYRGVTLQQVISGELLASPFGRGLVLKGLLVAWLILYQLAVGHRPAPRLIYVTMVVALTILALSVLLVRAPNVF